MHRCNPKCVYVCVCWVMGAIDVSHVLVDKCPSLLFQGGAFGSLLSVVLQTLCSGVDLAPSATTNT